MANAQFIYRDEIARAVMLESSAAVDDLGNALSARNLQLAGLGDVARFTGKTLEWVRAQWTQKAAIDTVAVLGHTASQDGEATLRLYDDLTATTLLTSVDGLIWPQVYGIGEAPMNEQTIAGIPILSDLDDYPPFRLYRLDQTYSAALLELELRDPASARSYLQLARLFAGVRWEPAYNFSIGVEHGVGDDDRVTTLGRGALLTERGNSWRTLRLTFADLSKSEADTFLADFMRRVRTSLDFVVVAEPDGGLGEWRSCIYGRLIGRPRRRQVDARNWGVTLDIEEIVQ